MKKGIIGLLVILIGIVILSSSVWAFTLRGAVFDENGKPMGGKEVTVMLNPGNKQLDIKNGRYEFIDVAPGTSEISAKWGDKTTSLCMAYINVPTGKIIYQPIRFGEFFADKNLEGAVKKALNISTNQSITAADTKKLTGFFYDAFAAGAGKDILKLGGLEYCTNLGQFTITKAGPQAMDFTPLSGLTSLSHVTYISFTGGGPVSLVPLSCLTNMVELWLNGGKVNDDNLYALKNMTKLKKLWLMTPIGYTANISNISALKYLKNNLKDLIINRSKISDINTIAELNSLDSLRLNSNKIKNISPIATLNNLTILDLSGNPIEGFSPIYNMTQLTELGLDKTGLSDIAFLSDFTQLLTLYLRSNGIKNISPLLTNTGLGQGDVVYLKEGNPDISKDDIDKLIAQGVDVE